MRAVTDKRVQTVDACVCGRTTVDQTSLRIKWRDLTKWRIRRKRDRATGKTWLLLSRQHDECHCQEFDWDDSEDY